MCVGSPVSGTVDSALSRLADMVETLAAASAILVPAVYNDHQNLTMMHKALYTKDNCPEVTR